MFASLSENLIQAVNMVGSMFYARFWAYFSRRFFLKSVKGRAIFYAALVGEAIVLICFWFSKTLTSGTTRWAQPGDGLWLGVSKNIPRR